jgi:hypothetical protein
VVRAGIFSIFLTILLLFGIWTGSLFAVRYAEIEKNEMMNPPEESGQDSERVNEIRLEHNFPMILIFLNLFFCEVFFFNYHMNLLIVMPEN